MVWKPYILFTVLALLAESSTSFARLSTIPKTPKTPKVPKVPKKIPTTQQFQFDITNFTAALDGYSTNVLGVNNQVGVPIIVNKGDTISLTATNSLSEPTALHFHGIFQNGTNWFDGSSMVTQCPIKPGRNLTYEFTVNDQHGTYWWHAHHNSQYVQGLRGPLIIRDPENEPYTADYDTEIIVQLADWFHTDKNILLAQYFAPNGNGDEPLPDAALINNKGNYCTTDSQVKKGKGKQVKKDTSGCVGGISPMEIFNVTQGQRVRFRIINMSAMATFNFSIDGHKMDVIEADGVDTVKTTVDVIRINVAQRYSVIVNMTQASKDYWVRAIIDVSQWVQNTSSLNPEVNAILHYGTATTPSTPTTTPSPNAVLLDPYSLMPYSYPAPPADYDVGLSMRFDILSDPNNQNITTAFVSVDGLYDMVAYQMPSRPSLFDVLDNKPLPNSSLPVQFDKGSVVELSIWNDDNTEHVFHLHGHQFWVIAHGKALNDGIKPSAGTNYPVRDTIAVPGCQVRTGNTGEGICGGGLGYVRIRFITNNPGVWLLHCHMEWHMAAGLAITAVVDAPGVQSLSLPASVTNTCNA